MQKSLKKLISNLFCLFVLLLMSATPILAFSTYQECVASGCDPANCLSEQIAGAGTVWVCSGGQGIHNPVLPFFGTGEGGVILATLLGRLLNTAFIIAGVVLLFMIVMAGYNWLSAGGDKEQIASAQRRLTNAIVGFILVVAARAIVGYIAGVLQIEWLKTLKIELPTP